MSDRKCSQIPIHPSDTRIQNEHIEPEIELLQLKNDSAKI